MPLPLRESLYRRTKLPRAESVLMGRAELLSQADRDLIESVMVHSQPPSLVARMLNLPTRMIRNRLHRLSKWLTSEEFLRVARMLPYLDVEDAQFARLYFLQRTPQRELAAQFGVSIHNLRRRVDRIGVEIDTLYRLQRQHRSSQLTLAPAG